jgi:hypothetical protein
MEQFLESQPGSGASFTLTGGFSELRNMLFEEGY